MIETRRQLAVLLCIGLVLGFARAALADETAPRKALPLIRVDETSYDFGRAWIGQTYRHVFVVRNAGNDALNISGIQMTPGLVIERQPATSLAPGETTEIPIRLDDSDRVGVFEGQIYIATNDVLSPMTTISVRAERMRPIEVQPPVAGFGRIIGVDAKQVIVTIANKTEESLDLVMTPPGQGPFACELVESTPGMEYKLLVTVQPPYNEGRHEEKILFKTNLDSQPKLEVKAIAFIPPRVEVIPPAIFVDAPTGKAADASRGMTKVLVLSNNGGSPVRVTGVQAEDPSIKVTSTAISEGKSYSIRVQFPPGYLPPQPGPTVNIETDDQEHPLLRVPISTRNTTLAQLLKADPPGPKRVTEFVGKLAPDFEFTSLDGVPIRNSDLMQKICVIDFFALGDVHNAGSLRKVEALRKEYESKGVRFINICGKHPSTDFTEQQTIDVLKGVDIQGQLVMDLGNTAPEIFKLIQYPTTVFLGRSGNVEAVIEGNDPELVEKGRAKLNALLANQPIPRPPSTQPALSARRPALLLVGQPAAAVTLNLGEGKEKSPAAFDQRPATVLNFVAPNCGFCRKQIPQVETVRAQYEAKGVRFVNVSQTMRKPFTLAEVKDYMANLGVNLELAYDPQNLVGGLFKVTSFPTMVVVKRNGVIEHVNIGAKPNIAEILRGQLDTILAADKPVN